MKNEELEVITNSIKDTLGEESTALIADSLGLLMSENTRVYNSMQEKDKKIAQLKENNDRLVKANANLLQRVPIAAPEPIKAKEEPKKTTSLKDCFDEKGNFKR
jgi:DNA anti-recombination protein RmuC